MRCGDTPALSVRAQLPHFELPAGTAFVDSEFPRFISIEGRLWVSNEFSSRVLPLRRNVVAGMFYPMGEQVAVDASTHFVTGIDAVSIEIVSVMVTIDGIATLAFLGGFQCENTRTGYLIIYMADEATQDDADEGFSRFGCPAAEAELPEYPRAEELFPAACDAGHAVACSLVGTLIDEGEIQIEGTTAQHWYELACRRGLEDAFCGSLR